MTCKSFIEYLNECGFIDPEDGKFKYLLPKRLSTQDQINEVVKCLKETLNSFVETPALLKLLTIAPRDVNALTIKKLLGIKNDPRDDRVFCKSNEIKEKMIKYILDLSLEKYFTKSAKSNNGFGGWIYVFVVQNHFDDYQRIVGPRSHKVCEGRMLYLKFNFKTYVDAGNNIKIDPKTILLDVVSVHPTHDPK